MIIRLENEGDADAIHALTAAAFQGKPFSDGTEAQVVNALRAAGALTISLVAEDYDEIVGHVAFSPVTINSQPGGWYGLGPISVAPARQRRGIGTALIETGFTHLRGLGAEGCVLLGDPAYYSRFGFIGDAGLSHRDVDRRFIQFFSFTGATPAGEVAFHPAFDVPGE